jgi:hypothetical protein
MGEEVVVEELEGRGAPPNAHGMLWHDPAPPLLQTDVWTSGTCEPKKKSALCRVDLRNARTLSMLGNPLESTQAVQTAPVQSAAAKNWQTIPEETSAENREVLYGSGTF